MPTWSAHGLALCSRSCLPWSNHRAGSSVHDTMTDYPNCSVCNNIILDQSVRALGKTFWCVSVVPITCHLRCIAHVRPSAAPSASRAPAATAPSAPARSSNTRAKRTTRSAGRHRRAQTRAQARARAATRPLAAKSSKPTDAVSTARINKHKNIKTPNKTSTDADWQIITAAASRARHATSPCLAASSSSQRRARCCALIARAQRTEQ